jgi:hypothetical protein
MTNMIGKSGVDWSKAPEGSTHRNINHGKMFDGHREWYKDDDTEFGQVYWPEDKCWVAMKNKRCKCISREEDLPVVKQVKTIADLEVGMFLKNTDGVIRLLLRQPGNLSQFITLNMDTKVESRWTTPELELQVDSWSYTYAGEYTPIIKETAKQKAIKAATEEIIQAQKALDSAKSKLEEASKLA